MSDRDLSMLVSHGEWEDLQAEVNELKKQRTFYFGRLDAMVRMVAELQAEVKRLEKQVAQWRDHATIGDETKKRLLEEIKKWEEWDQSEER